MKKRKYVVTGVLAPAHADCEAESLILDSRKEALRIKKEWEKEEKYLKVFVDRWE